MCFRTRTCLNAARGYESRQYTNTRTQAHTRSLAKTYIQRLQHKQLLIDSEINYLFTYVFPSKSFIHRPVDCSN